VAPGSLQYDDSRRSPPRVFPTYKVFFGHFTAAKTLGITATPDRSDQRSLGEIFEETAFE